MIFVNHFFYLQVFFHSTLASGRLIDASNVSGIAQR